jgi:hypothetical protein
MVKEALLRFAINFYIYYQPLPLSHEDRSFKKNLEKIVEMIKFQISHIDPC